MIYVIGMGVEGAKSLSDRALDIVARAGLVVGGSRHLAEFPDLQSKTLPISGSLARVVESIRRASAKTDVAVLATGDPLFFGIGETLLKEFGKKGVSVVPNVSVVQEAFARIKEPSSGAVTLSVHGRPENIGTLAGQIMESDRAAIFTDGESNPGKIARALVESGADGGAGRFRAYVCERLGLGDERVRSGSLGKMASIKNFKEPNVMILIRQKPVRPLRPGKYEASCGHRRFGLPDECFSRADDLITREELRAVVLSKLGVKDDSVVWDVGAGSGSVAIEAARLATRGKVFAVEKNAKRAAHIKKNISAFGLGNISLKIAEAPACLKALPAPHAVFIGGGGKGVAAILCRSWRALSPGGRAVVNAVTMETALAALGFFKKNAAHGIDAALLSVAKAKDVGGRTMFSSGNPVFIITGVKAGGVAKGRRT